MSRFLCFVSKGFGVKDENSRGAKEVVFVKAKTGGFLSQTTLLVNDTDKTLYLRDKVGAAYGGTRYKIPGRSHMEVSPLKHTFFRMIAYAVEEADSTEERDSLDQHTLNTQDNSKPGKEKKKSIDTKLSIDSDQLANFKEITIICKESGYELEMSPR